MSDAPPPAPPAGAPPPAPAAGAPPPAAPAGAPPPRPVQAGLKAGAVVVAFTLLALGGLYLRGTRTSTTPLDPQEPTSRPLRQLGVGRDGPRVEAALVIERPVDEVWAVVTDYARFGEIFQPPLWTLRVDEVAPTPTGVRLRGEATSRLWRFPVDVAIAHTEQDGGRVAAWDAVDATGAINRGRWSLRPLGPTRTQVSYEAEVRAPGYPAFLVNDLLLAEVGYVLTAVRDRLDPR